VTSVSNALAERQNTLANLIDRQKGEIARALPKHMTPDRLARIATTVMRQTPQLGAASPASFLGALMTCAQLGLEPGPLGHAYLVPFKNGKTGTTDVQFIPGYRGLIELARRSGQVQSVSAHVVREGDEFDYAYGLNERCHHKPNLGGHGKVTHVYAVIRYKDGGADFEVMTRGEVEAIRDRSRSSDRGPWVTDWDEMAKKTVLKRLLKRAPMSVEYQQAVVQDEQVRRDITLEALDYAEEPEPDETVEGEIVEDPQPAPDLRVTAEEITGGAA
jgi:recombination protein RecT